MENLVVVRVYRGDGDDKALQELPPRFVIMYDAYLAFIRRVEADLPFEQSRRGSADVLPDVPELGRGTTIPKQSSTGEGRIREADQGESFNGVASANGRETCGGRY
ncbi:hypothetical protein A4X13_0g965 [Tilletia indica]|uniref:Uncharacterized protein n=1 Tax=Tilletia indica TaxID=43049 RepID=A0A177TI11_9BASI|nr:hypothetical protein A4X13_0g965 [Tilletia indica]